MASRKRVHHAQSARIDTTLVHMSTSKQPAVTEKLADEQDNGPDESAQVSTASFAELGLAKWLDKQCSAMGLKHPTPVQVNCVPAILKGQDCRACSKTGSGKTAAFALPILQSLSQDPYGVFAVILTPTRELAYQIADQFKAFGKPIGLRDAIIVGGLNMTKQALELKQRPHVIIATPGRLADHITSSPGVVHLKKVKYLVLDEADRLFMSEDFLRDMDVLINELPKKFQTLMFSATMPKETPEQLAKLLHEPVFNYSAPSAAATVSTLNQRYIFIPSHVRHGYFATVLRSLGEEKMVLVFTSTCKSCEELAIMVRELGIRCQALHGQMSQPARLAALAQFKSGLVKILIATDVASRGLDIPTVQTVINFTIPKAVEDYVHRVGRTARAGRGGMAISLVSERDVELIQAIEDKIGVKLELFEDIKEEDVLETLNEVNSARRTACMKLIEFGFMETKEKRRQLHEEAYAGSSRTKPAKRKAQNSEDNE